ARLLQAAEMQREQLAALQVGQHPGQLGLGQLEAADRLAELLTGARVVQRRLQAGPGRSERPPDDPEPGLAEARQRSLEPGDAGQYRVRWQLDVVEVQFRGE